MNYSTLRKAIITTFASIIVSAGVYFFMIPYNLTIGGMPGINLASAIESPAVPPIVKL